MRAKLDALDREIVELIAQRFDVVNTIGHEKSSGSATIRDPAREQQVLESVEKIAVSRGLPATMVRRIYEELLSQSVARQASGLAGDGGRSVRVGFQGVEQAYSYLAAGKYLAGQQMGGELIGHRTFSTVVGSLLNGDVDLAVLPIENTTAGSINEVYELVRSQDVSIVGEETWKVDHALAGVADVPLTAITKILASPEALAQCSRFLVSLPEATAFPHFDTASAMREVGDAADPTQVAIGSPEAAAAYGLVTLRRGIANQEENYTRFVVLAREPKAIDLRVPCKTSMILTTRHERGALLRCLEVLSANGLSMTKLESRPLPGRPWEYTFFLDVEGNSADPKTAAALDELRGTALHLKVLGSYPAKAMRVEAQPGEIRIDGGEAAAVDEIEAVVVPDAVPRTSSKNYRLAGRGARAEDTTIRVGDLLVGGEGFVVMAGPCSVESQKQIEDTARAVRDSGAHILRGGVFKPRTSPYAFQGLAWEGLELLAAAGRESGMPIVSEVMAVEQVKRMSERVDILQVGARNMQNFDLLRELGKVDRPVLLKRGLSSTIEEWLGAAEYILAQGNQQVILCERGIRTFESATRNTLDLSAVCVLRERTHLPVIVDPSHGTGYRPYVAPMARAARAAGAHGLLIEVHPEPERALSDSDQSLSFPEFAGLMRGLQNIGPAR